MMTEEELETLVKKLETRLDAELMKFADEEGLSPACLLAVLERVDA